MTPATSHSSAPAITTDDDASPEERTPISVGEAFARAAREMRVPRGKLECFLPEWAERVTEQVDYDQFHQLIRRRIVEVMRPEG